MEGFKSLKAHLGSLASVPPTQWVRIATALRPRKLKADELYFREHEPFDEIGFVVKGLLYNFHTKADGTEVVSNFRREGQMVTCYSDLLRGSPASFSSKALEPTMLLTLKYEKLQWLYDQHPCWDRLGRLSAEKLFAEKEYREFVFMNMDAKARYEIFVKQNRSLLKRVPQYLIASFIGVSAVSLSRIRGQV